MSVNAVARANFNLNEIRTRMHGKTTMFGIEFGMNWFIRTSWDFRFHRK